MMNCKQARAVLWPADALRLSDEVVARAIEHAEGCEECAQFLEQDRRTAELIREHVPRVEAPPELRERLFTALARERAGFVPPRRRTARWRHAAVLALILAASVATVGVWISRPPPTESPALAFTRDYLRRMVEQESLITNDPDRMTAFFARELGLVIDPPQVPGYVLDRGLICLMNDQRGAVIEYRIGDRQIAYYVIPRVEPVMGGDLYEDLDVRQIGPDPELPYRVTRARGLTVATWTDPEHHHALIGNAGADQLRGMLSLFECPLFQT